MDCTLSTPNSASYLVNDSTVYKNYKFFSYTPIPLSFLLTSQVTASDEMTIAVYNYNSLERITSIDAHSDYIRQLAVHPGLPQILSCSDDMSVKLWNWEKNWVCERVFEGHSHYVMAVAWNPKDAGIFATGSLDRTVKVWGSTGGGGY